MSASRWRVGVVGSIVALGLAGLAQAQPVSFEDFETPDGSWLLNGIETIVSDGSQQYLELPYLDFFGMTLSTQAASTGVTGDLNRYPAGLRVSFDIRTFAFDNFNGEPIDPNSRPLILHLHDRGDPEDFTDDAGVWISTTAIPDPAEGWQRREYTIPAGAGAAMPAGWAGTGGEDPVTFEPTLPPGRTYANVIASIDEAHITTFQPGYFYGFCFFHMGIDNIRIEQIPSCRCDWNNAGGLTVQDIFDFLADFFANQGDFNGVDGTTVQDIFDFLACYFTGC